MSGIGRVVGIVALGFVLGCGATGQDGIELGQTQQDVEGEVGAGDDSIACEGSTEVTVSLTGQVLSDVTPVNLGLVLDESGSVRPDDFEVQRQFAQDLVLGLGGLFSNGGAMSLSMFATDSRLIQPLTGDQAAIASAIGGVTQLRGYTCIGCGLETALDDMLLASAPGNERSLIVVTDGANNRPRNTAGALLAQQVSRAAANDVTLFAVGVGSNVVQAELELIAGDPSRVFNVADFGGLSAILGQLAAAVLSSEATDVAVELDVHPDLVVDGASATSGAVNVVGNRIEWFGFDLPEDPNAPDAPVVLTYEVSHIAGASAGSKIAHTLVSYSDAEGNPAPDLTGPAISITESDSDGLCDAFDNCPTVDNVDQADADLDSLGDVCDSCPNDADNDADTDGVCGDVDNCPAGANGDQLDSDGDGAGDVCDDCAFDAFNDIDADGVCGDLDNCATLANFNQADSDGDGIGDLCDACPNDADNDIDGDGICGDVDNCPADANADQIDRDGDGLGDACDPCTDIDGDGVCVEDDLCADTSVPELSVPSKRLGVNRFALVDGDGVFDTVSPGGRGPRRSYTVDDTAGCSCEQIIVELDRGQGHVKFGCSISTMDEWTALVSGN